MTVYAVALAKGGVAKTATAAEIAATLARAGRRVLVLDLDEQGNLTDRLGITEDTEVGGDAFGLLVGECSAAEAAAPSPSVPGAWVVAGTHRLAEAGQHPAVIVALRDYLPQLAGEWDDVVIDTPPAMSLVTLAGLAAADVVVAAVACTVEAYKQLGRLDEVIARQVAPRLHPGQAVHWIVPTMYDGRRRLDRDVVEGLNEAYPGRVTSPVREAVAVADAYTSGMPVSVYAPDAEVSKEYEQALDAVTANSRPAPAESNG